MLVSSVYFLFYLVIWNLIFLIIPGKYNIIFTDMEFPYARYTYDLEPIHNFYRRVLGFNKLSGFACIRQLER